MVTTVATVASTTPLGAFATAVASTAFHGSMLPAAAFATTTTSATSRGAMVIATAFAAITASATSRGAMVIATAFAAITPSATSRGAMVAVTASTEAAVAKHMRSGAGGATVLIRFMPPHQRGERADVSQRAGRQDEAQHNGHRDFARGPGAAGFEEAHDLPPMDTEIDQRQSDGDEAESCAQCLPGILTDTQECPARQTSHRTVRRQEQRHT